MSEEAMSMRELEEIEEKRLLARGAPLSAEAIVALGELIEEDILNLLREVRRSHAEAVELRKRVARMEVALQAWRDDLLRALEKDVNEEANYTIKNDLEIVNAALSQANAQAKLENQEEEG